VTAWRETGISIAGLGLMLSIRRRDYRGSFLWLDGRGQELSRRWRGHGGRGFGGVWISLALQEHREIVQANRDNRMTGAEGIFPDSRLHD